jgi:hypothetical protein
MKFFNGCSLSREEVINIVNSYVTNIKNEITGTIIPCAATICDDVTTLKAVNHRFFISDGISTEEVNVGETVTLEESVETKVKPFISTPNTFGFAIDTTGATDGQVFTYDLATDAIVWQDISAITTTIGNTLTVSKLGVDATATRESVSTHYLTISAAIADSLDGDTILIYPGIYNEGDVNINSLTGVTPGVGYDLLTFEFIGDVTFNGGLVATDFGINIIGPGTTFDSDSASCIDFTGTSIREVKIDLLRVQSSSLNRALSLDTFLGATINIDYINNVEVGASVALGVIYINNINTVKYQGISIFASVTTNVATYLSNIDALYLDVDILNSADTNKLLFTQECTGTISISKTTCSQDGFKLSGSNLKINNTNIEGVTGEGAIIQIEADNTAPSRIIFTNCIIEGSTESVTGFERHLVNIGVDTVSTTDYCQVKFDGCTILNNNTFAGTGCLGLSGGCVSSNIIVWFQNCHLFSGSATVLDIFDCGGGTSFQGDSADVYYLGYNTANVAVGQAGNTNFIGTLNVNAAFVDNIAIF